jgi:hypothetical protein
VFQTAAEGTIGSGETVQMKSGITGHVTTSPSGRPLEGAVIEVMSKDRVPQPTPLIAAVTDHEGRYSWPLPPGTWDVTVSAPGHRSSTQRIVIQERTIERLDFALSPDH